MRVLVTGGTSLLGASVIERLANRGDDVVSFQRSAGSIAASEVLGDLTDPNAVDRAMRGVDSVIHLAAKVGVVGSEASFREINVDGTRNVIEAAQRGGVSRVVHVSSPSVAHAGSALVGASAGTADPTATRGHYATTKAAAELLALRKSTHQCPIVAIRPHLVWGPGDTQLVGRIVERAKQGRLALIGNGSALIDSTYIDNAGDALVAALDQAPTLGGRAFVVSNDQPRTVRELLEQIVEASSVATHMRRVPTRAAFRGGQLIESVWNRSGSDNDPPLTSFLAEQLSTAHWFDQRETQTALGWQPAVSLEEGFRRLRAWYQNGQ